MNGERALASPDTAALVTAALAEDLGPSGDVTTEATIPPDALADATVVARESLVLCGLPVAREVFARIDPSLEWTPEVAEGDRVDRGTVVARLSGAAASILSGERVALNFLQHCSGIATQTARYVEQLAGTSVLLLDTRKTRPGLRVVEKYAVRVGGGHNHRFALYDGVLIKDNHIAAAGGVDLAVSMAARRRHPLLRIEVEVESEQQAIAAVRAGADALLLDNRTPAELRRIVAVVRQNSDRVFCEASGGITLDNLAEFAATGVDAVSCGAIIHGASWVDLSLDLVAR